MRRLLHRAYGIISRLCSALPCDKPSQGLRILLYHSVGTKLPKDPYGTGISSELFKDHMAGLAEFCKNHHAEPLSRPAPGRLSLSITFDDGYADVLTAAAPILTRLGLPFTVFIITEFARRGDPLYLNVSQLKQLSALPGVLIGSHSKTHRPLVELSDPELKEELADSRRWLENLLGKSVTALSYPYGRVDRRVRDAALEAGYAFGLTSRYGLNSPTRDPLLLCRTEITAWDNLADLNLKIDGSWDWFSLRHPDPMS